VLLKSYVISIKFSTVCRPKNQLQNTAKITNLNFIHLELHQNLSVESTKKSGTKRALDSCNSSDEAQPVDAKKSNRSSTSSLAGSEISASEPDNQEQSSQAGNSQNFATAAMMVSFLVEIEFLGNADVEFS
jgi:hypothetical protein